MTACGQLMGAPSTPEPSIASTCESAASQPPTTLRVSGREPSSPALTYLLGVTPAGAQTLSGPSTGIKNDSGKLPLDLLDPLALEGIAGVLQFGALKYAPHNWRGGLHHSRLYAAALRHLFAWHKGEDYDPESGLRHIDHAACCLMFLANMTRTRPDLDDRSHHAK